MKPVNHPAVLAMLLGSCLLAGCAQGDPAQAGGASSRAATMGIPDAEAPSDASTMAADHPCQLLTDSQVRDVFPGAAAGARDDTLDKYGIATCRWDTATDRFIVQMLEAKSGSVEDELRSRMSGSIDPMMAGAGGQVRYATIAGIGDEAMLVVEKADQQRGILADTAVMVTQRGNRRAVLFTGSSLAGGDRAAALKSLETLGRNVAKRL